MTWRGPTFRTVDGERIDGAWCHVWHRDEWRDTYVVEDLLVYADGTVRCERTTDLAGLERMLDRGLVAVTNPAAPAREEPENKWESRSPAPLTQEGFLLEVADKIEELAGRPTVRDRFRDAIERFRETSTDADRSLLRDAYLAIAPHLRIYCLGDMDRQDRPLRILFTDLGEPVDGDGPVATAEMHRQALDYFRDREKAVARARERETVRHADDPTSPGSPAIILNQIHFPNGRPADPGLSALRNDFPVILHHADGTYPSVHHGYWALSTAEEADRLAVRDAPTADAAHELGALAPRREDWSDVRLAVMAGLLRAKFTQHPALAEILLGTGDARISYSGYDESPYWRTARDDTGRNWVGRLLELVRSELFAAGISSPTGE
ncbi:NADAR family protein [Streptomyces sp. NPDC058335]|uniref:NADAR family protein n=1 Tax=Streptomyces sp. NPDC058335 TaxID=3346451 RepID=UPI0036675264